MGTNVWYIVVAPHTWGRGRDIDTAKKECRKAGGTLRSHLVYRFDLPEDAKPPYMDDMGMTVSHREGTRTLVAVKKNGRVVDPATV